MKRFYLDAFFHFIFSIILIGFSQTEILAQASGGTIRGRVVDDLQQPVAGAQVYLAGTSFNTSSDADGYYVLSGIPAGIYTLKASRVGFVPFVREVTVTAGSVTELNCVTSTRMLEGITVLAPSVMEEMQRLPDLKGTYLTTGIKNEVIQIRNSSINTMQNNGRSVFARVPGAFVYEFDGTGNALNIATRGLDPHRNWEFNIRMNDVLINSDLYGYPANHFNPPMEAVDQVQLIRGSASLQYGAQFGGMLNFILSRPDTTRPFSMHTQVSRGSFDFFSAFVDGGGQVKKLEYYFYYNHRTSDTYRENARYQYDSWHVGATYHFSPEMSLKAELSHMYYVNQLAGALTDSMFYEDPRQSTRFRNYYAPRIWVPALNFNWKLSDQTTLNIIASGIRGNRNSVLFLATPNIPDTINAATLQYNPRQVDIDEYNSNNFEIRVAHEYDLASLKNRLVSGLRLIYNDLHRFNGGKGTTGIDYDLTITGDWRRDMHLISKTSALFVENSFGITDRFSITPGLRLERGASDLSGKIQYYADEKVPQTIDHNYLLTGIRSEYRFSTTGNVYAGWSQAYRPMLLKDIIPLAATDSIDPNLKDVTGWNGELGVRGTVKKWLNYDVSLFGLSYKDRITTVVLTDSLGNTRFYKTNIGDNFNKGVEVFFEFSPLQWMQREGLSGISLFTSSAYMQARYTKGTVRSGNENIDITGNHVESAPDWNLRSGLTYRWRGFSATLMHSYVSETYADALNTREPNKTGTLGLVPEYHLWDFFAAWYYGNWNVKMSITNLFDKPYFTKRPTFFPDPGIWPGDGRNVVFSVGMRL
ncbi:MAG: TonB-dependent receptor [Chitinophagales bacterium]|nr:TonB-dependent receptor [Chitinophagales bacterium]MDW8392964.1 TonB-dependent receptor [Chitinophagales bacterium]